MNRPGYFCPVPNLGKGPDDVRFIFGARFDVARLFAGINQPF